MHLKAEPRKVFIKTFAKMALFTGIIISLIKIIAKANRRKTEWKKS